MPEMHVSNMTQQKFVPQEGECVKSSSADQDFMACQIDGQVRQVESDKVQELDVEVFDADNYFD